MNPLAVLRDALLDARIAGDGDTADALVALAADPDALADALREQPAAKGFVGKKHGAPPFPGAVFNETSHRWEKPAQAASPKPKPGKPAASKPAKPRVPEQVPSAKAARAKAAHHLVDKTIQRYAEEHNEPAFAKAVGGLSFKDNEPVDVVVGNAKGVIAHGIELKTMVSNKAGKITMKKSAMDRKAQWEQEKSATFHTVVIDDSAVFNAKGEGKHDPSKRKLYYRRGYGSFRVHTMHRVKSVAAVKKLLDVPDDKLPPAAKRTGVKGGV